MRMFLPAALALAAYLACPAADAAKLSKADVIHDLDAFASRLRAESSYLVLSNESCFSATDGFLAAFSELPNVTLMGAPSRGGSGSARSRDLPRSGISVRLSTMASFRPCGTPFEGIGVAVDVESQPPPEDFVTGGDSVLERALQRLRDATAAPESHAQDGA